MLALFHAPPVSKHRTAWTHSPCELLQRAIEVRAQESFAKKIRRSRSRRSEGRSERRDRESAWQITLPCGEWCRWCQHFCASSSSSSSRITRLNRWASCTRRKEASSSKRDCRMIAAFCEQDLRFLLWAAGDNKQELWFACKFAGACGEEEEVAASSGHGHGFYPRYRPYTLLHLLHIRNSIR